MVSKAANFLLIEIQEALLFLNEFSYMMETEVSGVSGGEVCKT